MGKLFRAVSFLCGKGPVFLCAISFLAISPVIAQSDPSLVGKYSAANKAFTNRDNKKGLELVIEAVDGDVITARGAQYGGDCDGRYTLEGKREKDHVIFYAKAQDARAGCRFDLDLVEDGNALVGTKNRKKVRFSR